MSDKFYNVYLKAGGKAQAKYVLDSIELTELIDAINANLEAVYVCGKTFQLHPFESISIYDFSKNKTIGNRGMMKDEVMRIEGILKSGKIELFSHFGIDVTHNFKINPGKLVQRKAIIAEVQPGKIQKIFISHSSKDKEFVGILLDLIEAIGVKQDQIFCSSYSGYGVALGEDFLARIRRELDSQVLVIFVLTRNFYESPIALCEMGAAWIKTSEHIPILVPPFDFKDVRGVFPVSQGIKLNDTDGLNGLKVRLETAFQIKGNSHPSVWERKRNLLLDHINSLIGKRN